MPSTLPSLQARLDALQETHKATLQLISRLISLKLEPGALPSTAGPDARSELTAEIHDRLKREDEDLEIASQEVQDFTVSDLSASSHRDSEREKTQALLAIQVTKLREDFNHARTRFRAAQVQSQRNARAARAQERQLLFSARTSESTDAASTARRRTQQDRPRAGGDEAVAASEDVTAALRRTQQLLHTEVERSRFAQEMFDQSTEAIKQLSKQYTDLDTLLANSRSLISTLVTSTKSDTWYLVTTFYILVGTIGWLVFRRFLYGPLWWLIWIPLKLLFRVAFFSLGLVGATSSSQSQGVSVPEVQSSATVTMASMSQASAKAGAPEKDTELKGKLSQQIADMGKSKEPVTRGDGEPLVHSDKPRNPKKRMFEAQVDNNGAEVEAGQKGEAGEGKGKSKGKDEL